MDPLTKPLEKNYREATVFLRYPRFLHFLYAKCFGYFWLACPQCGRMFGGQERHGPGIQLTRNEGRMTCNHPQCVKSLEHKLARSIFLGYETPKES